jgi:hypothetical protein
MEKGFGSFFFLVFGGHPFPIIPPTGSLHPAFAPQILYKPSTSLPCHVNPEDGNSMFLRNDDIDLRN